MAHWRATEHRRRETRASTGAGGGIGVGAGGDRSSGGKLTSRGSEDDLEAPMLSPLAEASDW